LILRLLRESNISEPALLGDFESFNKEYYRESGDFITSIIGFFQEFWISLLTLKKEIYLIMLLTSSNRKALADFTSVRRLVGVNLDNTTKFWHPSARTTKFGGCFYYVETW